MNSKLDIISSHSETSTYLQRMVQLLWNIAPGNTKKSANISVIIDCCKLSVYL